MGEGGRGDRTGMGTELPASRTLTSRSIGREGRSLLSPGLRFGNQAARQRGVQVCARFDSDRRRWSRICAEHIARADQVRLHAHGGALDRRRRLDAYPSSSARCTSGHGAFGRDHGSPVSGCGSPFLHARIGLWRRKYRPGPPPSMVAAGGRPARTRGVARHAAGHDSGGV